MTVIAWDGVTLAADRRSSVGYQIAGESTKIFRINGHLVGCSGVQPVSKLLRNWFASGAQERDFPEAATKKEDGADMLVIAPDGQIRIYNHWPEPNSIEGKLCTIGSGSNEAMVAMYCGKSAREAVEIASLFDMTCGNGFDTLQFE